MNKKLLIITLIITMILSFSAGVFAEEVSILQTVKLRLMDEIRTEATTKINNIEEEVRVVVGEKLNTKGNEEVTQASSEIQTYLSDQVTAIGNSQKVQDQMVELEVLASIMIQEQKDAIDAAINAILQ